MEGMRTGEALVEKLPALAGAHLADPRFTARGGIVDGADFDTSLAKDRPAVPGDLAPDALDGDCGGQVEAKAGEGFGGDGITNPDPREVSAKLMAREGDPAKAEDLNVLAAAWIQFQTHGWFSRDDGDEQDSEDAPDIESDDTRGRAVRRAPDRAKVGGGGEGAPAWRKRRMRSLRDRRRRLWDASQVYGRGRRERDALRTWQGGKLKIGENGLLPLDPRKGVARTGSNDNWWIALSALHHLFVKEHNHICEQLAARHPDFDDAQLYRAARLCVCALIAKIHAEWRAATRPRKAGGGGSPPGWRKAFRARGTVGEKTDHEGVRHTWPEEFASVYRLHPFMLDYYSMRSHEDDHKLATKDLFEVSGKRVRSAINEVGMASAIYSMGTEPPGAPTLHNCPALLRALRRDGGGEALDMVAADISLDRQHGVPRYNDFRELAGLKRLATFAEITPNLTWQRELEDVYKDVDSVDLMAGMLAEPPPEGCSLSETALRLLDAMAPEEVGVPEAYTECGGRHVDETGLADVLLRHHPELGRSLEGVDNAFQPWKRVG
eukprot:evm.model.scf_3299.1 EVM.evm.TU.scf_3299.1   scf_3299:10242-13587(-)